MDKRVIIIGGGPAGLGAAWRLRERGHSDWTLYERRGGVGGLSASFVDDAGFTWDLGGHVLFSHYPYFDRLLDRILGDAFMEHRRESWIRIGRRWVPYPFQNNIGRLGPKDLLECLVGLHRVSAAAAAAGGDAPADFRGWIHRTFGDGIARLFMLPYNEKVWATPLDQMDKGWIAERVSVVDFERILENVILRREDAAWGPNSTFRYPARGGTGALFNAFLGAHGDQSPLGDRVRLGKMVESIDTAERLVHFADGSSDRYGILISTMPLDSLVEILRPRRPALVRAARELRHNGVHAVGIGVELPTAAARSWMYFPEARFPFYRVTNLSRYSPWMVPGGDAARYSSFLCECAFSPERPVDRDTIVEHSIDGLVGAGLLARRDRSRIVTTWHYEIERAYPVPTLGRNRALAEIQPALMESDILSRGRFGAWRYEVGNMDHSVMMGVEAVDRILSGASEATAGFRAESGRRTAERRSAERDEVIEK